MFRVQPRAKRALAVCVAFTCPLFASRAFSPDAEARTIFSLAQRVAETPAVAQLPDGRIAVGGSILGLDGRIGPLNCSGEVSGCVAEVGGIAAARDGSLLIADRYSGEVIRRAPSGSAVIVAGNFNATDSPGSGDGGLATAAVLAAPRGLAVLPSGGFLVADTDHNRIRRVDPDGRILPFAGNGAFAYGGDGGPARQASLRSPSSIARMPDGSLLVADAGNHRVRRVGTDGVIRTVAGNGKRGFSGDGGAAPTARLTKPAGVAADGRGGFLIADTGNNRLRRVDSRGTITTVAGNGGADRGGPGDQYGGGDRGMNVFNGDGRPARLAALGAVRAVAVIPDGSYLIAAGSHLRFLPSATTGHLAINFRAATPRRRRISYSLTRSASVRLTLRRGKHRRVLRQTARRGYRYFRRPRGLRPGAYHLVLRAQSKDGHAAKDEMAVVFGGRLSRSLADQAINGREWGYAVIASSPRRAAEKADTEGLETGRCRRLGRRRVDCRVVWNTGDGCDHITAVRLGRDGQVRGRDYRCGRFRRHPPGRGPAYMFRLLG